MKKVALLWMMVLTGLVSYAQDVQQEAQQVQEQAQQVHPDGKSGDVGYEDNPAVAPGVIGLALPLQDDPEQEGGEEAGEGIDFSLYSREPERVTEGIDQGTHQSAGFNADNLSQGHEAALRSD